MLCSQPRHAQAHHRILVYHFRAKDGTVIDGSMDDLEFGAESNLLKHFEERRHENIACVITRWYGGEYRGVAYYGLMRDLLNQVVNDIEK